MDGNLLFKLSFYLLFIRKSEWEFTKGREGRCTVSLFIVSFWVIKVERLSGIKGLKSCCPVKGFYLLSLLGTFIHGSQSVLVAVQFLRGELRALAALDQLKGALWHEW